MEDNLKDMLVEILARLRLQDQMSSTTIANSRMVDGNDFEYHFSNIMLDNNKLLDAYKKSIREEF